MKKATGPAIFNWRQTEPELILCAVRWHLRHSLSFRDVEELLSELSLEADHTTIWRWVQRYGPELEERYRCRHRPIQYWNNILGAGSSSDQTTSEGLAGLS